MLGAFAWPSERYLAQPQLAQPARMRTLPLCSTGAECGYLACGSPYSLLCWDRTPRPSDTREDR